MTWTDPNTRNTGDLITASIWNADVVDNLEYLHQRVVTLWLEFTGGSYNNTDSKGLFRGLPSLNIDHFVTFDFCVPPDFGELVSAEVVNLSFTSQTLQWDLNSQYGVENEAYNTHEEADTDLTKSVEANDISFLDVSSVLSGIAAGDVCAIKITSNTAYLHPIALRLRYKRS